MPFLGSDYYQTMRLIKIRTRTKFLACELRQAKVLMVFLHQLLSAENE